MLEWDRTNRSSETENVKGRKGKKPSPTPQKKIKHKAIFLIINLTVDICSLFLGTPLVRNVKTFNNINLKIRKQLV